MICLGGDTIVPKQGYYRIDNTDIVGSRCLNPNACAGGISKEMLVNMNGFCNDKFTGTLCS